MKKELFYKIFIVLLLLLNLGTLGYITMRHPDDRPGGPHGGPDRLIIETLKLDDKQRAQFEDLKKEHHGQMIRIDEESGKIHQQLFELLKKEPVDTMTRNKLFSELQKNSRWKEWVTFEHFRRLRGILRPDQTVYFDDFVQVLSKRLLNQAPPPPGR